MRSKLRFHIEVRGRSIHYILIFFDISGIDDICDDQVTTIITQVTRPQQYITYVFVLSAIQASTATRFRVRFSAVERNLLFLEIFLIGCGAYRGTGCCFPRSKFAMSHVQSSAEELYLSLTFSPRCQTPNLYITSTSMSTLPRQRVDIHRWQNCGTAAVDIRMETLMRQLDPHFTTAVLFCAVLLAWDRALNCRCKDRETIREWNVLLGMCTISCFIGTTFPEDADKKH